MKYEGPLYTSSLLDFYFSGMRIGVLDIETTGLNPARATSSYSAACSTCRP
ncbi:MAG: hypothetical protein V8R14_02535 [Clostridia bacterium]